MKTAANISSKERGTLTTMFFNQDQIRELLDISDFALILMQHYVAIGKQTNPILEDAHIAKMVNKPVRTVEKTRLALTKAGWFKREKTTKKGEVTVVYFVGKEAVQGSSHTIIAP